MWQTLKAVASPCADDGLLLFQQADADIHIRVQKLIPAQPYMPLLLTWLSDITGMAADQIELKKSPHGKPYINHTTLAFNISHSQHWFALAWSFTQPSIGVDIENSERQQNFTALSRRYFHVNEQALPPSTWLTIWTRKEAALKAHGLGLRITLADIDTSTDIVQHAQLGQWQLASSNHPDVVISVSWPALQ